MKTCPSSDALMHFLDGTLAETESQTVQEHIDSCSACQALLEDLADDDQLRSWLAAHPSLEADTEKEPYLAVLLEELQHDQGAERRRGQATPAMPYFLGPAKNEGDLGTLGTYRVQAELGRGGMGIVFQAYDEELQRTVAIKVLRPDHADEQARARFVREAQAAARVRHDHLVDVHAVVNPAAGPPYLVMEYIAGPTLAQKIKQERPLPPRTAAEYCAQAAEGLSAAHAVGLIHRDIKPSNILLDPISGRAKIMDFGLARDLAAGPLTRDSVLMGTPAYISPEQVQSPNHVDPRTDVYSLGVTLYECLTGEEPFRGIVPMVLRQVLDDDPRPPRRLNDAIPPDLETICLKAMAKEPVRRYPTAQEFGTDLRRWLRGEPIKARPAGAAEITWRWCRRNPVVAGLLVAVFSLLVIGAGVSSFFGVQAHIQRQEAQAHAAEANRQKVKAERSAKKAERSFYQSLETVHKLRGLLNPKNEGGVSAQTLNNGPEEG